ncbi:MAG: HypC/HybG/HupF family hydrogenase formation chaperone [Nitrospirota bacterium]
MCLAVPSKIINIKNNTAIVDVYGARREISLLLMEGKLKVGDYVLVHAGFAIQKVDKRVAKKTIQLLEKFTEIPE